MTLNRDFFFSYVRRHLFGGSIKPAQMSGLDAILAKWRPIENTTDDRWLAYMLGTAHHETGRTMQPVRETFASNDAQAISRLNRAYNAGKLPWVSRPYWNFDDEGKSWIGRGLVQITHKSNYQMLTDLIDIDLMTDPTVAMQMPVAIDIMFEGMRRGAFTGHKLADFFLPNNVSHWRNARKIINGIERADLVADYAESYYAAISHTT